MLMIVFYRVDIENVDGHVNVSSVMFDCVVKN